MSAVTIRKSTRKFVDDTVNSLRRSSFSMKSWKLFLVTVKTLAVFLTEDLFTIRIQPRPLTRLETDIDMPTGFRRPDTLRDLRKFLNPILPDPPSVETGPDQGAIGQDARDKLETRSLDPMNGIERLAADQNFDNGNMFQFMPSEVSPEPTLTETKNTIHEVSTGASRKPELQFGEGLICVWSNPTVTEGIFGSRNISRWERRDVWGDSHAGSSRYEMPELTLNDCFDEFSSVEALDGEQAWFCPRCDKIVPAKTTLDLWRVPEILIIQLKRFDAARNRKVDTFIKFPITDLDLTDRIGDKGWLIEASKGLPLVYDLVAVANHCGGLQGGHWTANEIGRA